MDSRQKGSRNNPKDETIAVLNDSATRTSWDVTMEEYREVFLFFLNTTIFDPLKFWNDGKGLALSYNRSKAAVGGMISSRDFVNIQFNRFFIIFSILSKLPLNFFQIVFLRQAFTFLQVARQ